MSFNLWGYKINEKIRELKKLGYAIFGKLLNPFQTFQDSGNKIQRHRQCKINFPGEHYKYLPYIRHSYLAQPQIQHY